MESKICIGCNRQLPTVEFYSSPSNNGRLSARCKPCYKVRGQQWKAANRTRTRDSKIRNRYGLEPAEWQALSDAQQGRCRICKSDAPLHVDHCHDTGRVRGLLCTRCNQGLGYFKDDEALFLSAITYLRETA